MKVKMNRTMKALLERFGVVNISEMRPKHSSVFQKILRGGILAEGGCLLLKANLAHCKSTTIKDFPDLTGYECYVNKVNVDDYLTTSDPKMLLEQTLHLAQFFDKQLSRFNEKTQILIGFQLDDIATSSVRFHKLRSNESWLNDDLEKYEEGILVWEVS